MSHLPAEHLGRARVFRQAVVAADQRVNAVLPRITAPLRRRLESKPTLRDEQLIDTTRAWQSTISDDFTLDLWTRVRKGEFRIAELRVCASRWRTESWSHPDPQPGVSLVWLSLGVKNGALHCTPWPVSHLLLHALGRRFERGAGRERADIVRDLKTLAAALDDGGAEEIPVLDGRWVGDRVAARDAAVGRDLTVFHCRTFLS
ncbi:MAG: hypothetical protein ABSC95_32795 [Acetobacteraceae bacterium]|jgi:hypothetical protein